MVAAETGSAASEGSSDTSSRGPCNRAVASVIFLRIPVEQSHRNAFRRVELEHLQQPTGPARDRLPVHTAQQTQTGRHLALAQPLRQRQTVRQHPDQELGTDRVASHVLPEDFGAPAVRPQQPHGHRQRGRLARPVRPHHSEERAARHAQVHRVHGGHVAESFGQPAQTQREDGIRTSPGTSRRVPARSQRSSTRSPSRVYERRTVAGSEPEMIEIRNVTRDAAESAPRVGPAGNHPIRAEASPGESRQSTASGGCPSGAPA